MWNRLWGKGEPRDLEPPASVGVPPAPPPIPEPAPERPPTQAAACTDGSCDAQEGWACAYRDRWGKECGTIWCDKHIDFIGEMAFCRRHANVMRALASASSLQDVRALPSVEDRSLSLVAAVTRELEEPVLELLRRRFGHEPDVQVVPDRSVRVLRPEPTRIVWERGWAAVRPQGYAGRVAVRVPVGEDPMMRLLVNNSPVLQTVPDWIEKRRANLPFGDEDHENFRFRILLAIEQALDAATHTSTTNIF